MRYALQGGFVFALIFGIGCTSGDQLAPAQSDLRTIRSSIAVTRLPSLGGNSAAYAINDNQVIVGTSNGLAVKWTLVSGSWQAQQLSAASAGEARDITESGVIVGSVGVTATLWPVGGGAAEAIAAGTAVAVNESEIVVGISQSNGGVAWTRSGTSWVEHTLPRETGVTVGFKEPSDINDDGVIVGYAQAASGTQHAVKWLRNTSGEWDPAVPLDNSTSANSAALGIVGSDIVGLECSVPSQLCREPFHWSLAGQGIGSLGSEDAYGEGLNSARFIVGSVFFRRFTQHAFVWSPGDPTIRDLGILPGYKTALAYDINNSKQTVGEMSRNRSQIAVLWTVP
jgi:probable HAF family extracellular repeat protein